MLSTRKLESIVGSSLNRYTFFIKFKGHLHLMNRILGILDNINHIFWNIEPDEGYQLKAGSLNYNGTAVEGTSFLMPGEDVVLSAEFEPAGTVSEPDKEALNAAIENAETLNEADYTSASWAALQEALNNAKSVAADEDADQNAIDAAVQALNAAIEALEEIGEPGDPASDAAIQALRNLIDKANALESDDETLNAAIAAAQALLDDPDSVSASAVVAAMLHTERSNRRTECRSQQR